MELEPLEERIAPAGSVAAEVIGGFLVITGDAADNVISIDQLGLGAGQFRIWGNDGTTVGGASSMEFSGVSKGIRLFMGGGSDGAGLDHIAVSGSVTFDGGDGDNTLEASGCSIGGKLAVTNGAGFQSTYVSGSVRGNLSITNGDGGSGVSVGASVGGNLVVKNGAGGDELVVTAPVGGSVSVTNGMGDVMAAFASAIGGNLTMKTLDGAQAVSLSGADVGKVTISHGSGDSDVLVAHSLIGGTLSLTNAVGEHTILMDEGTSVLGAVKVINGDGGSATQFENVTIGRGGSIVNGAGLDWVDFHAVASGGGWSIGNGDGGSQVVMDASVVRRAFAVAAGDGINVVDIDTSEISGGVKIANGDGDSGTLITETLLGRTDGPSGPRFASFTLAAGAGLHEVHLTGAQLANAKITTEGRTGAGIEDTLIKGTLAVRTGAFDDEIAVKGGAEIAGAVTIDSGAGNDAIAADDVIIGGSVTVKAGDGNDVLLIENYGDHAGPRSTFAGRFTALMGGDDDMVFVGVDGVAGHAADFAGRVTLDGGLGSDTLDIADLNTFAFELAYRNFEVVNLP